MSAVDEGLPVGLAEQGRFYVSERDGAKMVQVPAGEFTMGRSASDIFAKPHEQPQRRVFLSAFYIDAFPVTNGQFAKFAAAGGYRAPEYWSEEGWRWQKHNQVHRPLAWGKEGWDQPRQPVAGVSWYEASAYATWAGKRLPTEAEWERAARGTDGRQFPWGDELPTRRLANFDDNVGTTTDVDAYPEGVSPGGCFDMAGNVNNWCLDWYWPKFYAYCRREGLNTDPFLDDELRQKLGIEERLKVDRGGGFRTSSQCFEVLSCTDRVAWEPGQRELWNGFRTAMGGRPR